MGAGSLARQREKDWIGNLHDAKGIKATDKSHNPVDLSTVSWLQTAMIRDRCSRMAVGGSESRRRGITKGRHVGPSNAAAHANLCYSPLAARPGRHPPACCSEEFASCQLSRSEYDGHEIGDRLARPTPSPATKANDVCGDHTCLTRPAHYMRMATCYALITSITCTKDAYVICTWQTS